MAKKPRSKRPRPLGSDVEQPPGGGPDEIAERAKAARGNEDDSWKDRLAYDKHGNIKSTAANLILIFENDPLWKNALSYDERSLRICWRERSTICKTRIGEALEDHHAAAAVVWLSTRYGISAKLSATLETMIVTARKKSFDALEEWLNKLTWDGTERLDRWLSDATGCPVTNYTMAVGAKFLISAIARAMRPGCKVDTMLILCGPQGTLKSTLLSKLAGEWFSDQLGEIGSKDTLMQLHGPWIIEMSELDSMGKRETSAVKAFLTATVDRFRPPYGRSMGEFPRRCVFAGTTNMDTFLRDDTGARRFWPVKIEEIDLDYIENNREQLWAEATHRFGSGENWWLPNDTELVHEIEEEQDMRRQIDPWEERIARWITTQVNPRELTIDEVLEGIGIDVARRDRSAATRAGFALKRLGWTRRRKRIDGNRTYIYEAPIHAVREEEERQEQLPQDGPYQERLGRDY